MRARIAGLTLMPHTARLAALREEFENGSNPIGFIPYALALRRERLYSLAIEVCHKGLSRTPGSIAGRTLLGRLYCDTGNYPESRHILEAAYQEAPEASGVRQALACTYLRVLEIERAGELLEALNRENPKDPEVLRLNAALRYILARDDHKPSEPALPAVDFHLPVTPREILETLVAQAGTIGRVQAVALVSLAEERETCGIGDWMSLAGVAGALKETRGACRELDVGEICSGEFDFSQGIVFFALRGDVLLLLGVEATDRLGRIKALFDRFQARLFLEKESPEAFAPEVQV